MKRLPKNGTTLHDSPAESSSLSAGVDSKDLEYHYHAYISGYGDANRDKSRCLDDGKAFVLALLRHHFPSEHFIIQPCSLGPIASNGLKLMLKTRDTPESDPNYLFKPIKYPQQRRQTDAEMTKSKKMAEIVWHNKQKWHTIEAKDMACFVILGESEVTETDTGVVTEGHLPFTYFGIMIDDPDIHSRISKTNVVTRADMLVDIMSRARLQRSYAMLLHGLHLEFYDFDNGKDTVVETEDGVEGTVEAEDPTMTLCKGKDLKRGLALDLRHTSLDIINKIIVEEILVKEVTYRENE